MTEQSAEPIQLEVMPPSAVGSIERAHIDSQIATAHAYPRSLEKFQKKATSYVTLDYETAASCLYSRPVGGGKTAEGASIRLAEIVASCFGNLHVQASIVEQTDRFVRTVGMAHDLENNYAGKSEVVESTVGKDGQPYSERQRIVVAKAALSKAYRDAVFRVVPKAMCKTIIDAAKRVAVGDEKTLEDRRAKVRDWVKSIKVDEARVFQALGIGGWADMSLAHLETMTGLRTAILDGDATIDETFPPTIKPSAILQQERGDTKAKESLL
jgi:hypothetical protein